MAIHRPPDSFDADFDAGNTDPLDFDADEDCLPELDDEPDPELHDFDIEHDDTEYDDLE